jgi:Site-specific recombinase XerD
MSSRFIQVVTSLLKCVIKLAIKSGYIEKNPFDDLNKLPKGKKSNPKERVLSKNSVIQLYNVLNASPTFKPMVILMLRSGLRIGEVLALRWTDIDEEKGVIHVEQGLSLEYDEDINGNPINKHYEIGNTKTVGSVRDVTVDKKVFEALNEWKQYVSSKPHMKIGIAKKGNQNIVFVNKSGDIRSYQALRKGFKRFLIKNGLGDIPITFHRFRHTYATLLSDSGVDINIIRDLLGHKDIETTANIYVSVNLTPKKRATKRFETTLNEIVGNN